MLISNFVFFGKISLRLAFNILNNPFFYFFFLLIFVHPYCLPPFIYLLAPLLLGQALFHLLLAVLIKCSHVNLVL